VKVRGFHCELACLLCELVGGVELRDGIVSKFFVDWFGGVGGLAIVAGVLVCEE